MQTETRGRKRLPENERKKPITIFLSTLDIKILGGEIATKKLLTKFSKFKIQKHAEKII
jgi:hypothetical protein